MSEGNGTLLPPFHPVIILTSSSLGRKHVIFGHLLKRLGCQTDFTLYHTLILLIEYRACLPFCGGIIIDAEAS